MNHSIMSFRCALLPVLTAALLFAACSEDSGTGPDDAAPPAPTVTGASATTVAPGDTITITGSNFLTPASANTVRFNNPYRGARAFAGTTTQLQVAVPEDANSGPLSVAVDGQSQAGVLSGNITVTRGVGEVFVFGGSNAGFDLPLDYGPIAAAYLLVPHGANPATPYTQSVQATLTPNQTGSFPVREPDAHAVTISTGVGTFTDATQFEVNLRDDWNDWVARHGIPRAAQPDVAREQARMTENFFVLNSATGSALDPQNYSQITAQLRYDGTHCLIYSDLDTLASGNLTQADFNALGQAYDSQLRPTNVAAFGQEGDVDGNGKVILLSTPVVNRLTPPGSSGFIGGFFWRGDLSAPGANGIPAGTTNEAEICYLLASDPQGTWGVNQPRAFVATENIATTAHEYQHLISFSVRLLTAGLGIAQVTWLEEGMAHMAEDLNDLDQPNINRANLYLAAPQDMSLEHNTAPLEQRGAIFLFLRYLADRYGEAILGDIVASKCTGRACIEDVTGENFYQLTADFLATLYLSGRGITSNPRYNYTSLDMVGDFSQVALTNETVDGNAFAAVTKRATGEFFVLRNLVTSGAVVNVSANAGARIRTVVVRIQ